MNRLAIGQVAAVALVYGLAARASLLLALPNNASIFWAPAGLAIAAVLIFGKRAAIGVAMGELVANAAVFMMNGTLATGGAIAVSAAFGAGNALEALIGASLYREWTKQRIPGTTDRSVFALAGAGASMSIVGATVGTASLAIAGLAGPSSYAFVWMTWWLGNTAGVLLFAPVVLAAARHREQEFPMGNVPFWGLIIGAVAATVLVMVAPISPELRPMILIPIVVYAAFRASPLGLGVVMASATTVAIAFVARGPAIERLLTLQMGSMTVLGAFLVWMAHATINERRRTGERMQEHADQLAEQVAVQTQHVRDANEHLQGLVESAFEAILTVDDGVISDANPSAAKMFAQPVEALIGQPIARWLPVQHGDYDGLLQLSGHELPVEVSCRNFKSGDRPLQSVTIRDLSTRLAAQHAEAEANRQRAEVENLQKQERFRTRFINEAAHELRTPLTPLLLHTHVLARTESDISERGKKGLEAIDRNVRRLKRIVDDLLDIGRYQDGGLSIREEELNFSELMEELIYDYGGTMEAADHPFEVEISPDIHVRGDPDRLVQIAQNLLSNADKYTPAGKSVKFEVASRAGNVEMVVSDQGIGMDAEQIERLFQPFSRVHETDHPGTGLGLYVSKSLTEMHQGRIHVASQGPGLGTTFTVVLPLLKLA